MGVEKVLQDFKKLLDNEDDTDVIIKVKEKEFKVHRGILGIRTPVFAAMFKHDMSEKNTGIVPLDDCEPDIFKDFLQHVYTGTVDSLSAQNAFGLYELSDKYQVEDLKEECIDCLKNILSVDTFCEVISLALKYDEKELLRLATELFCREMKQIIVTVKWQTFMCENPSYVNELLIKRVQFESN